MSNDLLGVPASVPPVAQQAGLDMPGVLNEDDERELSPRVVRAGWRHIAAISSTHPDGLSAFAPMPPNFDNGRTPFVGQFAMRVRRQQRLHEQRNQNPHYLQGGVRVIECPPKKSRKRARSRGAAAKSSSDRASQPL
jgi:hypothetical protein